MSMSRSHRPLPLPSATVLLTSVVHRHVSFRHGTGSVSPVDHRSGPLLLPPGQVSSGTPMLGTLASAALHRHCLRPRSRPRPDPVTLGQHDVTRCPPPPIRARHGREASVTGRLTGRGVQNRRGGPRIGTQRRCHDTHTRTNDGTGANSGRAARAGPPLRAHSRSAEVARLLS